MVVDDVFDLGSIDGLTPTSSLNMVDAPYTDREVRIHLTRFREILSNFQSTTPSLGIDVGVSYLSTISGDHPIHQVKAESEKSGKKAQAKVDNAKPSAFAEYGFEDITKDQLSILLPEVVNASSESCLKSFGASVWNPPPPHRRMAGDFLYLHVVTVEGVSLQITCNVSGFYISRSNDKVFDPLPRATKPCHSHTITGLLSEVSLRFANRFPVMQAAIQARHPYEYLLTPVNYYPWCVKMPVHEPDSGRTLDSVLLAAEASELMASRDWNEDIQAARELPRTTPQDRVVRDQVIHRHHSEFIDAAAKAAVSIATGSVPSINPSDPEPSRMYIYGGIFFSHGNDQRESYERFGGAAAAHAAVGKDIDGISAVSGLDIEGLFTLGTAVVDYKGHRFVAQTIIPGILKKQQQQQQQLLESEAKESATEEVKAEAEAGAAVNGEGEDRIGLVKYGSIDNGKSISSDPVFHEIAERVAKSLHLAEHVVLDGEGQRHYLYTSVDTKGITGEDGRRYLLDLGRVTPVDIEFLDQVDKEAEESSEKKEGEVALPAYPHRITLLRSELVEIYHDAKLRAYITEQAEKRKEKEAAEAEARKAEGGDAAEPAEEKPLEIDFDLRFNPDAFALLPACISAGTGGNDPESTVLEGEQEVVRQMSKFLTNNIINSAAFDLAAHPSSCPIDGQRLTKYLHARGINLRYLGKITALLEKIQGDNRTFYAKELCLQEMISRAAKTFLRDLLKDTPLHHVSQCISEFLNCLYADPSSPKSAEVSISLPFLAEPLTPATVHESILFEVRSRFRYGNMSEADLVAIVKRRRVPLLRSLALKVGIQFLARDRDWESGRYCFDAGDVLNIYPIVKHAEPKTSFGDEVQEHGLYCLRQGQTQVGVDLLAEASSVYEQVYTPVHPESGRSYRNLAMIRYESGDMEACKVFQRKAVIVAERTSGFDDPETCQQYMNLGYFECLSGNADAGFRYMRHALRFLEVLAAGELHPELASADTQIAMMLSHTKRDMTQSTKFQTRAVNVNETIFGKDHEVTARSYEHLCQGLMLAGDFRGALEAQRVVYRHVKARAGDKDDTEAVKEAAETLAALTSRAVLDAKKEKEVKAITAKAAAANAKANGNSGKKNGDATVGGMSGAKKNGDSKLPAAAAAAGPDGVNSIAYGGHHLKNKMAAQLSGQTAGSMRGNKGHLSIEELLKFIDDGGSNKKKKDHKW
ncbi:hypothetical protein HDU97_006960 [Phlyctochytrium planicorne]|nr:hypothetical protein HDU97_006960 [Phlyctochytrium planicorne]